MKDEYVIPMFGHAAVMFNIDYYNEIKTLSELYEKDNNLTEIEKDFIEVINNGANVKVKVEILGAEEMAFSSNELHEILKLKMLQAIIYRSKEKGVESKRVGADHLCGKCERILNESDFYCSKCGYKIKRMI